MGYEVKIKRKVLRNTEKMPEPMQDKFFLLIEDLRDNGPILPNWPNYSRLSENRYHCHLGYKWVACWKWEEGTITIEVYYAGSRENAPY